MFRILLRKIMYNRLVKIILKIVKYTYTGNGESQVFSKYIYI